MKKTFSIQKVQNSWNFSDKLNGREDECQAFLSFDAILFQTLVSLFCSK